MNDINELIRWKKQVQQPLQSLLARPQKFVAPSIVSVPKGAFRIAIGINATLIQRGDTGTCNVYEGSPPTDASLTQEFVFDWLSQEEISAGKEIGIIKWPNESFWRVMWAECEDPEPPTAGILAGANQPQVLTVAWDSIPGLGEELNSGEGLGTTPGVSGYVIDKSGTYQINLSFSFTVDANNTAFQVRYNTNEGPGTAVAYEGRTAGDTVSAAIPFMINLTDADITANNNIVVFEVSAVAGTESGTWDTAAITVERLGVATQ